MGLLRLILALAVIVAHVSPWMGLHFFGGGVMAVECFYILSGFYMALVLARRYQGRPARFYFNRFVRLFPIFWLLAGGMLLGAAIYWAAAGHPISALAAWREPRPWWQFAWAALSNFAILGSDAAELVAATAPHGDPSINRLLFIQPAWTLAVEILFYLAAPWLLRLRLRWQLAIFVAAILIRVALWHVAGDAWSPWLYYFAPASWIFFLSGVWAHHLYRRLEGRAWFARVGPRLGWIWLGLLAVLIVGFAQTGVFHFQDWRFYLLFSLGVPFIFAASQSNKTDAWLAQWSYPLYLAHWAVVSFYHPLRHFIPESGKIHVVILASFALAALLIVVDERIRQRFKRTDPAAPQPASASS